MKTIEVVAAIITNHKEIFVTQRGYGEFKGLWEFPGGKMEKGETREDALKREIREELETEISVLKFINTIEYDYPNFHLIMHCYLCEVTEGNLVLKEHQDACWMKQDELDKLNWLPADLDLIVDLKEIQL